MKIDVLENAGCARVLNVYHTDRVPRKFLLVSGNINLKEGTITFNLEIDYIDYTVKLGLSNFPFLLSREKYEEHEDFSLELLENALEFYPDSFKWKVIRPKKPSRFSVNYDSGRLTTISNCVILSKNEVMWLEEEFSVHLAEPITCSALATCMYPVK